MPRMFLFTDLDDLTESFLVLDKGVQQDALFLAADAWPKCNFVLLNGGNEKRITCVVAPERSLAISTDLKTNWRGKAIGDETSYVVLDDNELVVGQVGSALANRGSLSPAQALQLLGELDGAAIMPTTGPAQ